jgi:toxin ParE1/3/4
VGDGRRVVLWTAPHATRSTRFSPSSRSTRPALASKVAEVVLGAADSLSLFAERGRTVPETDTSAIREIFVYRYRVMYEVLSTEVRILTVLHGAMDFERWLRRQR